MYCVFPILSVNNYSKCKKKKKRFSGRFGTGQNDFRDVSGTVVKTFYFNAWIY